MKKEYDFSKAQRGRFYRTGAKLSIPIYLDGEVQRFVAGIAQAKRSDISKVVNDLLKSDMRLAKAMQ